MNFDSRLISLSVFIYLEQGEKLKRQASDASEKAKTAAKDAKEYVEEQSGGLLHKLWNILIDVKNSILGK